MRTLIFTIFFSMVLLKAKDLFSQSSQEQITYPKSVGYLSFILPLVKIQGSTTSWDFQSSTTIGFPFGVNVLYSKSFGFSFEITPSIQAQHPTGKSATSKMSNVLLDPGPMFRFNHGFTIITRLAFETSGRYGFTPVFNKIYARTKAVNYFVAGSLPLRFGNNEATSIGASLQFGFIFN